MKVRTQSSGLFARWFWIIYAPLGSLAALLLLLVLGILPKSLIPALILLFLWSVVAIRLLVERKRLKLDIPPPRSMMVWTAALAGLILVGAVLLWFGAADLTSGRGVFFFLLGCFLLVLALLAPAFKLLDFFGRKVTRLIKRSFASLGGSNR